MIDFYNSQITDILPSNVKNNPVAIALSYAISNMVKKTINYADKSGIYACIDVLDDEILDLLAVEMRAQYYDAALPVEDKRKAVKKALLWYCRAGTVSAVEELTNLVWRSDSAEVQEWFKYGAEPYLFRIVLGTNMSIEEKLINAFLSALWKVKNTRSHLESIAFKRKIDQTLYVGAASHVLGNIIIMDVWKDNYNMRSNIYSGAAAIMQTQRIRIKEG